MHPLPAKFLTENFGVLFFRKHENLKVLPLPGHRVSVTREGAFALAAKIPEHVIILPHAFLLRERHPVGKVLLCRAEDTPIRVQRKRCSIGPLMTSFVPGYFRRCTNTSEMKPARVTATGRVCSLRSFRGEYEAPNNK
jgi:hypothetical protein